MGWKSAGLYREDHWPDNTYIIYSQALYWCYIEGACIKGYDVFNLAVSYVNN